MAKVKQSHSSLNKQSLLVNVLKKTQKPSMGQKIGLTNNRKISLYKPRIKMKPTFFHDFANYDIKVFT